MKPFRLLLVFTSLVATLPAQAAEDEALGHALTLVQMFVRAASRSDDPNASLKALDDVLAGRNTEANRAFAGLFEEATADMPAAQRDQVAAIGMDLAALARKEAARAPALPAGTAERALQARKELTAMGLSYYDQKQFLEAVKRNDELAVELYVLGRGVNVSGKGRDGRTALDIARGNRNARLEALLARNLPAER